MAHMASMPSPIALKDGYATIPAAQALLIATVLFILYTGITSIYAIWIYPFYVSPLRRLPTPKNKHHWILGQMVSLFTTPWVPYLYREWSTNCPDAPFLRILKTGNAETLVPNTVAAYREILQTKNDYFVKPEESRKGASLVIGDGLPWVHGESHRQRRAVLNRLFSPAKMKLCVPKIEAKVTQLSNALAVKQTLPGEIVEVEPELWKIALDIGAIKTMGVDLDHLGSDESPLYDIFTAIMRPDIGGHLVRWLVTHLPLRQFLPLEMFSKFVKKCTTARSFIGQHVRERRISWTRSEKARGNEDANVLQAMIEQEGLWNDSEVIEYILNFLVLGHDTTACSMVWAVDRLSRRPDIQDRLRHEVSHLNQQSWPEIDRLQYLDNFVREVLRVHCPVGWIPREATCDIEVAGVFIPQGTTINLVPAMVNIKPEVWGPDAGSFDPDRWDHLQGEAGSAYAFATFHNGPRVCIGKALSLMEMKMVIAELVSRFRIEAAQEAELELDTPSFTLKPKELLHVRLYEV